METFRLWSSSSLVYVVFDLLLILLSLVCFSCSHDVRLSVLSFLSYVAKSGMVSHVTSNWPDFFE